MSQWDDWLAALKAARKGPVRYYAHRNTAFESAITVNTDLTGATMRGQVRSGPDSNTPLAGFTVSSPVVASGTTTFTISLSQATLEALPADTDADGQTPLTFDVLVKPIGGTEEVLFGGEFIVLGGVTQ